MSIPDLVRQDVHDLIIRDRGHFLLEPFENHGDIFTNENDFHILVFSARQGGGNDECYCDNDPEEIGDHEPGCLYRSNRLVENQPGFIDMKYDDFDCTYNYFYFKLEVTPEEYYRREKEVSDAIVQANKRRRKELIKSYGMKPELAENDTFDPERAIRELNRAKTEIEDTDISALETERTRIEALRDRARALDPEAVQASGMSKYQISQIKEYNEAVRDQELRTLIEKEIEELPEDSSLREYLFRDRGTFSYTDKVIPPGRKRAVKVTKTAKRSTKYESLISDLEVRDHILDSKLRARNLATASLNSELEKINLKIYKFRTAETKLKELQDTLF